MFAFLEDKITYIADAGKGIDYTCPDCGKVLRVRDGVIRIKHFYHKNSEDCGGTGESLVHKFWKEKVSNYKKFAGYEIIDSKVEFRLLEGKLIPDIIFKTSENEFIAVEICYKNKKTSRYNELFYKCGWLKEVYEIVVNERNETECGQIYTRKNYELILERKKKAILKFKNDMKIVDWLNSTKCIKFYGDDISFDAKPGTSSRNLRKYKLTFSVEGETHTISCTVEDEKMYNGKMYALKTHEVYTMYLKKTHYRCRFHSETVDSF